jgi:hypothetical protein
MKNMFKVFGIIALVAVIGFSFAACGGGSGGGGGGIPVKMKAFNNEGNPALYSMSMSRAVGGEGGLVRAPRAVEDASFNDANATYAPGVLGTKVGEGIDPDQFKLVYSIEAFLSDGRGAMLAQNQSFDFTKNLTVPIGDVPADIAVSAIKFSFSNTGTDYCMVQFEKPAGITKETVDQILPTPPGGWDGNKISCLWDSIAQNSGTGMVYYFVSYGDTRKLVDTMPEVGIVTARTMVTPFEPLPIPSGTSSVSLNVSWDLNDIIEQWTGENGIANDSDDKFVFKKGWWNNVYVTASVQ